MATQVIDQLGNLMEFTGRSRLYLNFLCSLQAETYCSLISRDVIILARKLRSIVG